MSQKLYYRKRQIRKKVHQLDLQGPLEAQTLQAIAKIQTPLPQAINKLEMMLRIRIAHQAKQLCSICLAIMQKKKYKNLQRNHKLIMRIYCLGQEMYQNRLLILWTKAVMLTLIPRLIMENSILILRMLGRPKIVVETQATKEIKVIKGIKETLEIKHHHQIRTK